MRNRVAFRHPRLFCALLAALALLSPLTGAGAQNVLKQGWEDVAAEIRPAIKKAMLEDTIAGMSIALVDRDGAVWTEGFGFADLAANTLADADTVFEIGSVSKTFTGIMVMQLAEQGKLDIDRPLTDYIPEFKLGVPARSFAASNRPITVRDMMNHHSGIPGDLIHGGFTLAPNPDFNDCLLDWLAEDNATYPPGYRWSYSNTAVSLLADVIEAASGQDFASWSESFMDSLGMAPASFFKTNPNLRERLSKPYADGAEIPEVYINIPAAGSIVASANQMTRYLSMLLGKGTIDGIHILSPETFEKMLQPQNSANPLDRGLSMGLSFILTDPALAWAGPLFWHNGATIAFKSHLEVLPEHGLAVIVIGNSTGADSAVADIAKSTLTLALKSKRGMTKPETQQAALPKLITLPERMLANLAGIYVNDGRGIFELLSVAEGGLSRKLGQSGSEGALKDNGMLYPWSDGLFRASADDPEAYEFFEANGSFVTVVHAKGNESLYAERFTPKPISAAWKARIGAWTASNSDKNDIIVAMGEIPALSLRESESLLILDNGDSAYVMEPITDKLAAVRGLGRFGGTSLHVVGDADAGEILRFMLLEYTR